EALRWLWREYPKPIVAKEPPGMNLPGWDPRGKVYSTVWADRPWEHVAETHLVYGLAADRDGNVFFTNSVNRIYKADSGGKVTVFKDNSGIAEALVVGADGRLYAAQPARKRIVSYGSGGDERIVAKGVSAGGIAATSKGAIYFTDLLRMAIRYVDA